MSACSVPDTIPLAYRIIYWNFKSIDLEIDLKQISPDFLITKLNDIKPKKNVLIQEWQTWNKSLFPRRECSEPNVIAEYIENKHLEWTVFGNFGKLEIVVNGSNVEKCYWINFRKSPPKIIFFFLYWNMSIKYAHEKCLKIINLSWRGIYTTLYINNSICTYYNML